ncbi:helix-turn-helix domain-containing protein [Aurantimicrobium minutum]|uniref:helix-turn-helix domain-containing protein n=1 Tax=Aurantimicrobium minutum TaxID=708131 RepID=UPI00247478F3|nr:helix-turn-helix domain-containing protein [Aurantimicrobium minutum]
MDLEQSDLSTHEKFVLVAIADHFNVHALCSWPSQSTLGRITGMQRATVNRAVKELRTMGLIKTTQVFDLEDRTSLGLLYFLPEFDPLSTPFVPEGEPVWREVVHNFETSEYFFFNEKGDCVHEFQLPK